MVSQFILNALTSGSGDDGGGNMGNLREALSQSVMGWVGSGKRGCCFASGGSAGSAFARLWRDKAD